jgi:MFS family permease
MSAIARSGRQGVDYRLLVPLMAHGVLVQTLTGVLRVTTSYRVLELGLPVVWLGAISATFALLPVFLAVAVGRYIDRGNDAMAARIGSALVLASSLGYAFVAREPASILICTVIMGVGHLFLMASQQMLCVRAARDGDRESVFGNFLVTNGIGQGLGPFIVGWVGGEAKIPDTDLLFGLGVVCCVVSMGVSLLLPVAKKGDGAHAGKSATPLGALLRIPGFIIILVASIITITAQDLIVIYLPLLGTERGIDSGHIGLALTDRSVAAIVSRLFYSRLIVNVGRVPLTVLSMSISGLGYALLGAPLPIWALYVDAAVMGLGLGIATTLSLTSVVDIVPVDARATALSLRITGNRIGQVTLPFVASLIAAAAGAPGVLATIGASLVVSAASVGVTRRGKAN